MVKKKKKKKKRERFIKHRSKDTGVTFKMRRTTRE
jgi:hypothetical protein